MKSLTQRLAAAAAILVFAVSFNAHAAIGDASVDDVTLDGQPADAFAYQAGWNPHAGPNGDTSGFGTTFDAYGTGEFELLDRADLNEGFANTGTLTFTITGTDGDGGQWTVTNTSALDIITLDLVFALHAGNQGGAWLFDNQIIMPGETLQGDWRIEWTVGAGNTPDYSNVTIFGRDIVTTPIPEPGTYAMLLAGLFVTGAAMRWKGRA
ncbi:PEP-CTERM sorting domain-containing protein [Massilia sp. METH4]|uniref:PEP-CTERM sorting domain-containing protein n=1 Tax=Massilia sp. METH4 TaxID=3123041 RepID=UPI0030D57667